jgi:hypothetical protein
MMEIEDARRLAYEALPLGARQLPGLTFYLPKKELANPGRCLTFDVLWSNPGQGSAHVGFWYVDRRTGEVWTSIRCKQVSDSSLIALQQAYRKKLRVTEIEVKSALKHPCCTPE